MKFESKGALDSTMRHEPGLRCAWRGARRALAPIRWLGELFDLEPNAAVVPRFAKLPNGHAVQLRPTALTANAGARRTPPERYHGSIGTRCWVSAATAC